MLISKGSQFFSQFLNFILLLGWHIKSQTQIQDWKHCVSGNDIVLEHFQVVDQVVIAKATVTLKTLAYFSAEVNISI